MLAGLGDAEEPLMAVEALRPEAVLTDIRMPPGHQVEGIEAAHLIRSRYPAVGVVVLSEYSDAAYAMQLFRNGTDGLGYLLKASVGDLDDPLHALREAAAGRSVVDSRVVTRPVTLRPRGSRSINRRLPRSQSIGPACHGN